MRKQLICLTIGRYRLRRNITAPRTMASVLWVVFYLGCTLQMAINATSARAFQFEHEIEHETDKTVVRGTDARDVSDESDPSRADEVRYRGTVSSGCSVQEEADGSLLTSPGLPVTGQQFYAEDTDGDGFIRAIDINATISDAHQSYERTGRVAWVIFDSAKIKYETTDARRILLDSQVTIRSGVVVDARQHTFLVRDGSELVNAFEFASGTTSAGLIGASVHSGNTPGNVNVVSSLIRVNSPAEDIYILDNELVGESGAYNVDTADGSNIWGLWMPVTGTRIFVYGNSFKWTPTGVFMSARGLSHVEVVSNVFENWRRRAIIGIARGDAALSGVTISHNTVKPPTTTDISKQPIAFQAVTGGSRDIRISWNKVRGTGEAHQRATTNTGTADNISVHSTSSFEIKRNCVDASGELGINVSRGSHDGVVSHNEVSNSDLTGINVQSYTDPAAKIGYYDCDYTELTHAVSIEQNIVRNNGKNQLAERPDLVSEIYVWKAHDIHISNNAITHSRGNAISAGIRSVCGKGVLIKNNNFKLERGVPRLNLGAKPPEAACC